MHYYVDGYNLLFRLAGARGESLQILRQQVIFDLNEMVRAIGINLTLVFDSPNKERKRTYYQTLEIIYTDEEETADDLILLELSRRNTRHEIVITSDKFLALQARSLGAKTQSVEEFAAWINQRYQNKQNETLKPKKTSLEAKRKPVTVTEIPPEKPPQEGSLEFYLKHFESQYQKDLEKIKTSSPPKISKSKKIQRNPPNIKDPILEIDRWLEIFEEKLKNESDTQEF